MNESANYIKVNGEYVSLSPKNDKEHKAMVSVLIQLLAAVALNGIGDVSKIDDRQLVERLTKTCGEMATAIYKAAIYSYARMKASGRTDA